MSAARRTHRLLIAAGVLVLLLGVAWLVLQQAFPPQRIAEIVASQVSSRTGREFRIQGRLEWRLLPKPAVIAEDMALANAPWGSRPDMLRIRRGALRLALWPLLRGQVHIDSVVFEGVDLLLETDAMGAGNWDMPQLAKAERAPGDPGPAVQQVGLDALRLDEVQLVFHDGASGRKHAVALQHLTLDRDAQGLALGAEAVLRDQRWQASGHLGAVAQLLANQTDWPMQIALRSAGARIDLTSRLLAGPAPRAARVEFDASIDKTEALAPWLDDAARLPLPLALKSSLALTTGSLQAAPLMLSLAGQTLQGSASVRAGKPWQAQARLSAESLDLTRWLPRSVAAGGAPAAKRQRLFDNKPLPIDSLPQGNATLELRIARLLLPGVPPISALKADARLRPGSLRIEPLAFGVAGGQMRGGITLDTADGAEPKMKVQIDAAGLSAEALARAADAGDYLAGGQVRLKADLAMSGRSASALAGSAHGELLAFMDDARLGDGAALAGLKLLPQLLRAITLQPQAAKSTQVECVVARLPFRNGVAAVQRSIAIETPDLAISAAGQIDLRSETMELVFRPTPKHALGLNTAQLASLVVAKGPLLDPKLTLDAKGAAGLALSIGAAVATGGLSALGQSLLKQGGDLHPCQYALTGVAPKASPGATLPPQAPASPEQVFPELLRKLFKK